MESSNRDRHPEGGRLTELYPGRSFESVVTDHSAVLLCLARKMVPSLAIDPEDLVQDTLERAWRARGTFRVGAAERPWLVAILCNRAREISRGERTRWGLRGVLTLGGGKAPIGADDAEEDEADEVVRRALATLPLHERAALVLNVCGQLNAAEVAAVLGCSTGAAHKRIQRARAHLVRQLAEEGDAGPRFSFPARACRQARRQLPAYLEGALGNRQREPLEAHLRTCTQCPVVVQAVMGAMARLVAAGHEDRHQPTPPGMVARLRAILAAEVEP